MDPALRPRLRAAPATWRRSFALSLAGHAGAVALVVGVRPSWLFEGVDHRAGPEISIDMERLASAPEADPPVSEELEELDEVPLVEVPIVHQVPVRPELVPWPDEPVPVEVAFLPRPVDRVPREALDPADPAPASEAEPPPADVIAVEPTDEPVADSPRAARCAPRPLPEACRDPVYPERAVTRRWEGEALCSIVVAADGHVASVTLLESTGHDALDQAIEVAVATWRFEPGTEDGAPVAMEVLKRFVFRLPRG